MAVVAIVGMGEMGACLAAALRAAGHRVLTSLEGRSEASRRRAAEAGVEDLPLSEVAAGADLFLSVLPPARAVELAERVAALPPRRNLLYCDCNAVSPATAERIARLVRGAGASFADVGIIGVPPRPVLYASGPGAAGLAQLVDQALDVRDIGGPAGRASALKMCYAAFTKGTTALATELYVAAARLGVDDVLRAEQADSSPQLLDYARRSLPGMPPKAARWVGELEEIAATFDAAGLPPQMAQGAADVYRLVERTGGAPAASLEELVARLARRPSVLFLCVHNAGRSQMAAGFLRRLAGDRIDILSGGSEPAESLNPVVVEAMAERGIDLGAATPRRFSDSDVIAADVVVTMGCGDTCPFFPGKRYEDWELEDPAGRPIEAVRQIRDEIEIRVRDLAESLSVGSR